MAFMLGGSVRRAAMAGTVVVAVTALVLVVDGRDQAPVPTVRAELVGHPLLGAWAARTQPSFFETHDAGIELRVDGRWSKLDRGPSGSWSAAVGWENEGWWEPWDYQDSFGVSFYPDGTGQQWPAQFAVGAESVTLTSAGREGRFEFDRLPAGTVSGQATAEGPTGVFRAPTEKAYAAAVAGAWLPVGPTSVFPTDDAGFELLPDGRWSKLRRQPDGSFVRGAGWGEEGEWLVSDISYPDRPVYQIGFAADGGPGLNPIAFLSMNRDTLRLHSPSGVFADYRRPPTGTQINSALNARAVVGVYRPIGQDDFVRTVTGRWLVKQPPSMFGTDEAGLDIRIDGRWAKLQRSADGQLVPTSGGRWEALDTSAMNGSNSFAIVLDFDGGGRLAPPPVFSADRQVMRLEEITGRADYVRL